MSKLTTEEAIERIVERTMNQLDKLLLTNQLSQEEYEEEVRELDRWARDTYQNMERV